MPSPQYAVRTLDLAIVRPAPGENLLGPGQSYDGVVILAVPAGSGARMSFVPGGSVEKEIPILAAPQGWTICPSADEGLFIINPAGAGFLVLLISFGGVSTP